MSSVSETLVRVIFFPPSLPAQVPGPVEVILCVFLQQLGTNTDCGVSVGNMAKCGDDAHTHSNI